MEKRIYELWLKSNCPRLFVSLHYKSKKEDGKVKKQSVIIPKYIYRFKAYCPTCEANVLTRHDAKTNMYVCENCGDVVIFRENIPAKQEAHQRYELTKEELASLYQIASQTYIQKTVIETVGKAQIERQRTYDVPISDYLLAEDVTEKAKQKEVDYAIENLLADLQPLSFVETNEIKKSGTKDTKASEAEMPKKRPKKD